MSKEAMKLALEAGIRDCTCNGTLGCLERFAELVRADERSQRTWVGLSDLNIDELENEYMKSAQTAHEFLRAIEAKLRSKNENRN